MMKIWTLNQNPDHPSCSVTVQDCTTDQLHAPYLNNKIEKCVTVDGRVNFIHSQTSHVQTYVTVLHCCSLAFIIPEFLQNKETG